MNKLMLVTAVICCLLESQSNSLFMDQTYQKVSDRDLLHNKCCDMYKVSGSEHKKSLKCGGQCTRMAGCAHWEFNADYGLCVLCINNSSTNHHQDSSLTVYTDPVPVGGQIYQRYSGDLSLMATDIVNECLSNPCVHGTCEDREDEFYCNCEFGYAGATCNRLVNCGTPSNPAYGSVVTDKNSEGGIASYSCNSGYNINGASQRTCQSSEEWSGAAPTCQPVNCGALNNPSYGSVVTNKNTYEGTATYSCNTGYNLSGGSQRTCQSTGSWSSSAATCTAVNCGALNNPTYGSVVTNKNTYEGTATYSCNTGYNLSGGSQRSCQSTGSWSSSAATCTVVSCGSLANPSDGLVSTNKNTYGGTATYSCSTGHNLSGGSQRSCQSTGSWSSSAPTCTAVSCGSLANPSSGSVTTNKITYGGTATYTCGSGTTMSGSSQRTCQSSGAWSGSAPTCSSSSPSSFNVGGKTVSCASSTTSSDSTGRTFICTTLKVDGSMRLPNHFSCTTGWIEWSTVSANGKSVVDLPSLCKVIGPSIWSTATTVIGTKVGYKCDTSQTRYKFLNSAWAGDVADNGFVDDMECKYNA